MPFRYGEFHTSDEDEDEDEDEDYWGWGEPGSRYDATVETLADYLHTSTRAARGKPKKISKKSPRPASKVESEPASVVKRPKHVSARSNVDKLTALRDFLVALGGNSNSALLLDGWTTRTEQRASGSSAGTSDTYFFDTKGARFRSRLEVARHFRLIA
jgi:hypothetical protein